MTIKDLANLLNPETLPRMKGVRGILITGIWLAALAAGAAWSGNVWAGAVYRCDSPDGSRTYSSRKIKGAQCTTVSSYTPADARKTPPPEAVARVANDSASAQGAVSVTTDVPAVSATPPVVTAQPPAAPSGAQTQGNRRRVQGQVYSYVKDGVRHYTSRAPRGGTGATGVRTIAYSFMETCYACSVQPGVNFKTLRLNTSAYDAEIRTAARLHGVDEAIVRAIIHAESAFNPNARSRVGAQGLMQLMPATARRFGVSDAYNPSQNIDGGVRYLAWLLKRFKGDLTLAAAGYNAGEGAVDRHKGVPPYNETRRYVERVRLLADRYRGVLPGRG